MNQEASESDSILSSLRVLLAEDNLVNQKVAVSILERKNVRVTIANNGKEAVEELIKNPQEYDVVLMDMDMPVMDGYEATKTLRELKKFEHLPIIAITAHSSPEDKKKCLSYGMNDHVAKPVRPDSLYNALINNRPRSDEDDASLML